MPALGRYSVAIIGLGQIGATYAHPSEPFPYCHAGGVLCSARARLVSVVDRAPLARERFAMSWGRVLPDLQYFPTVAAMLEHEVPDIVAVCIHEPDRHAELASLVEAAPRAVFLEKPSSCSLAELEQLMAAMRARNTGLTVSYSRHWSPHVLRLAQLVRGDLIGQLTQVVAYSPGERVLSFACHTIDLVCQFAGYKPRRVTAVGDLTANPGAVPPTHEPEPSYRRIVVEFEDGVVGTINGAAGPHGYWYCDVIGTAGVIRAGMYTPPAAFRPDGEPIPLDRLGMPPEASVFAVAYDNIAVALDGGPPAWCSGGDAVAVNEIGFAAVESMHAGRPVGVPVSRRDRQVYVNA